MTAPSWTLLSSPMTMTSESPRSTAVGQTETRFPRVTSPRTTAVGWMNAVGSIFAIELPSTLRHENPPRTAREGWGKLLSPFLTGSSAARNAGGWCRCEVTAAFLVATGDEREGYERGEYEFGAHDISP